MSSVGELAPVDPQNASPLIRIWSPSREATDTVTTAEAMTATEWHPLHMHQVVGMTMVIKHWIRPLRSMRERERLRAETEAATREVNTSLVFEPLAITVERVRCSLQQQGREPSQSSIILGTTDDSQQHKPSSTSTTIAMDPAPAAAETVAQPSPAAAAIPPVPVTTVRPDRSNGSAVRAKLMDRETEGSTSATGAVGPSRAQRWRERARRWRKTIASLPRTTVDPAGVFYGYWTFVVYLAFLHNAIVCVLFVFDDTQGDTFFAVWTTLNGIFDCINLADVLVNSRLSYMDDGMHVRDLRRLAKRYMRSAHFVFDIAALLPLDLLLLINRGISLVRVNRLAKCYRVWEFVQMTNVRTNYPNAFRILHILVVCVILFHWNAALYFKISLIHGIFTTDFTAWEFNYVKNSDPIWVRCGTLLWGYLTEGECGFNETGRGDVDTVRDSYKSEMAQYWANRSTQLHFSNFSKQYSLSFYWSSLTLTTSGQQPYPTAAMHNFLEIFDTIVGVLVFAVIVGSVGNVVSTMNRGRAEIQQLNDGIKFYMNYRNVSDAMQKRVIDCIHYIRRHAQIQNEESIMDAIPPRLRGELAVHLHMEILRRVDLFTECEPSLLYELVLRLRMQMFAPNDFLCRRGDLAREMFVLKRGVLEVLGENGELERMSSGAFGEMSILKPVGALGKLLARRHHSLRSLGYSEVYLLSQEDALDVFADYPEQRSALVDKATRLLLEREEIRPADLAEPGPLAPLELCGTESSGEVFQLLKETLDGLDAQLDQLYDNFSAKSAELKQRMAALEDTYRCNKEAIKRDAKRTKKRKC